MVARTQTQSDDELLARARALTRRPYRKVVQGDDEQGYLAFVPELPGCMTAGATEAEALENLREAMEGWLMSALDRGLPVPEPSPIPSLREDLDRYSGRLLVRMPRSLHVRLLERAKQEGVSANQLAVTLLARELG